MVAGDGLGNDAKLVEHALQLPRGQDADASMETPGTATGFSVVIVRSPIS